MFKLCEDDDFDFSEDFLEGAFNLNKKNILNENAVDSDRNVPTLSSKSAKSTKNAGEDCIESLLDDDWDVDDDFLSETNDPKNATIVRNLLLSGHDSTLSENITFNTVTREKDFLKNRSSTPNTNSICAKLAPNSSRNISNESSSAFVRENHNFSQIFPSPSSIVHHSAKVTLTPVEIVNCQSYSTTPSSSNSTRPIRNNLSENAKVAGSSRKIDPVMTPNLRNPNLQSISIGTRVNRYDRIFRRDNSPLSVRSPSTDCTRIFSRVKRKFPGPAGILPDLPDDGKFPKTLSPIGPINFHRSPKENGNQSVIHTDLVLSQSSQCPFEGGAWRRVKKDFDIDDSDPNSLLARFNIAWILLKASAKELPKHKAPVLLAILKSVTVEGRRASVVLQDETGEMKGTIHERIFEEYAQSLQPGTVMVLRQISIFSPSSGRHYLNITPSNVVALYSSEGVVNIQNVDAPELLASAEKSLLEATTNLYRRFQANTNVNSPSLWNTEGMALTSGNLQMSHGKSVLFQTVAATNDEEDLLWETDEVDAILQNMDEKDLCG